MKSDPNKIIFTFAGVIQWKILHAVKGPAPIEKEAAAIPIPALGLNPAQAKMPLI